MLSFDRGLNIIFQRSLIISSFATSGVRIYERLVGFPQLAIVKQDARASRFADVMAAAGDGDVTGTSKSCCLVFANDERAIGIIRSSFIIIPFFSMSSLLFQE